MKKTAVNKTLRVKVTGSFPTWSSGKAIWSLRVEDAKSRCAIAEFEFTKEEFFDLMSNKGYTDGEVVMWDTYELLGKTCENNRIKIQDDRLKSYNLRDQQEMVDGIIDSFRKQHDVDGWKMSYVSMLGLSRDQLDSSAGTLWVPTHRFIDDVGESV